MSLIKAEGPFQANRVLDTKGRTRMVFYGEDERVIGRWLGENSKQKITFHGRLLVCKGTYSKTRTAKSELHDGMLLRHQGWGTETVGGDPLTTLVITLGMKAGGLMVDRAFLGLYCTTSTDHVPTFMHNESHCEATGAFLAGNGGADERRGVTLGEIAIKGRMALKPKSMAIWE